MNKETRVIASLPGIHNLRLGYLFSLLIALMTGIASIAGLLFPNDIYPTVELRQSFLANDVVNLVLGLPILLGSIWLAWRDKLIGLLLWPGAILYGLYNYTVYLFGMPFNVLYPLYLVIVTLSIYAIIGLVASIDGDAIKGRLSGQVPERMAGVVLLGLGLVFMLRVIAVMVNALANQTLVTGPELGLLVADFTINATWVIGGILLWRRQVLGYMSGTGLLFQASMLFMGAIAVLIIQPLLSNSPLILSDIIVLFLLGLICFIPFILFIRGVIRSRI